ncbi:MAG TPA: NADH-quinone oxidoreductase subunit NuoE [Beijerinckiaceae bacterium]|nr:NADH-quinone oxidoreductase subunit NuoE [Beijerinckiaceae bacterium]
MAVRRLAPAEDQPQSFAFTAENERWVKAQIAKYPPGRQASAVIPLLWRAQEQAGWVPQKAIEAIAEMLGMAYIRVLEVATFYTMFNLEPVGRHLVQLCGTVPCHVKGAVDLRKVLERRIGEQQHVTNDGLFSWVEVECLGACCNAPMVQINADYYEDLTPEILDRMLDDLAAGRPVKPGSQIGRVSSEPHGEVKTLTDQALFDGSVVGAWRKRFEEEAIKEAGTGEAAAATASAPSAPKPAKPDAGRAIEREVADTPAKRVKEGERTPPSDKQQQASDPSRATAASAQARPEKVPSPQTEKSYTGTPSKQDEGRTTAAPKGVDPGAAGAPGRTPRRDDTPAKPPGSDIPPEPGVPPTKRK